MKYFYVTISRLTSKELISLAEWRLQSGVETMDYASGGWTDQLIKNVIPHLRFDREGDAIAYVLAHGGSYSTTIPQEVIDWNNN